MSLRIFSLFSLVLCLLFLSISDHRNGFGILEIEASSYIYYRQNRKLLRSSEEVLRGITGLDFVHRSKELTWNLRSVPSGPDPLHHNGNPKKPQTP